MSCKVLIADDAPVIRMMLRGILESQGYEVVAEACNGVEALKLYQEHQPDLVTMDIVMPERTGVEALGDILSFDPKAKVIMVSAIDQRESLMEAIRLGAKDYVVKPFEDDRVISAVQVVLGKI